MQVNHTESLKKDTNPFLNCCVNLLMERTWRSTSFSYGEDLVKLLYKNCQNRLLSIRLTALH